MFMRLTCGTLGKFTPKDRSRLEVAAESLQQVSRERDKYRDQVIILIEFHCLH